MVKLTEKQAAVLSFMLAEGQELNGSTTVEETLEDNMCISFASELAEALGMSRQAIGGVISGLIKRGFVQRGDKRPKREFSAAEFGGQWELWLTCEGVRAAYEIA